MSWIDPRYLEGRRKYWTRPDAYRFAPPGTPEAKMPGWLDPSATRVRLKEAQEEEARAQEEEAKGALAAEIAELQASHERVREMLAEVKYELAWRKLCREFGYTLNQQRDRKYDGQPRTEGGMYDFGKRNSTHRFASLGPDRRVSVALLFTCEEQYRRDVEICKAARSAACYAQAALRYGNCLAGKQIPPLNF
jgi:hypothetical protein